MTPMDLTLNLSLDDSGAVTGTWKVESSPPAVTPTPTPVQAAAGAASASFVGEGAVVPAGSTGRAVANRETTVSSFACAAPVHAWDSSHAAWHSGANPGDSFEASVSLGASPTSLTLFVLDFDQQGRSERIEILDAAGSVLATHDVSGFAAGKYLSFQASGDVRIRIATLGPADAVLTAVYVGGTAASTPTPTPPPQPTPVPTPTPQPVPTPASAAGGTAFAMCSDALFLTEPTYPPALLATGARTVRLDASFQKARAKRDDNPDHWDWSDWEGAKKIKTAYPQLGILLIAGYGSAAYEDTSYPVYQFAVPRPPVGIDNPPTDPSNPFGHYINEAVRRYGDILDAIEPWNEPDLPGHPFFAGDGRDFFPYQKACYLAAKAARPNLPVLFAGMTYASTQDYLGKHVANGPIKSPAPAGFFEQYLAAAAQDPDAPKHGFYFDVINLHPYSRASDGYDYPLINRALAAAYGAGDKPVWLTETGISDADAGPWDCTPAEYPDYLLQLGAWSMLAGVARLFHFQLDDTVKGNGLYKGMLGDPKPALIAYRDVLTAEFSGVTSVKQIHGNPGIGYLSGGSPSKWTYQSGYNAFDFQCSDGKRRLMAWSDTSNAIDVKLPATKATATLVTNANVRTTIAAVGGAYPVSLAGATNLRGSNEHLMGGATVVIVENAN